MLGRSDGTPGQRFACSGARCCRPRHRPLLTVLDGDDEQTWIEVSSTSPTPGPTTGTSGWTSTPARSSSRPPSGSPAGSVVRYGAVPAAGAVLRIELYRTGGGRAGNVARGQVRVLKTSVPYVARVENRGPAVGGAEAETLADAKARGPMLLRSRGRAVTAEDFEQLAQRRRAGRGPGALRRRGRADRRGPRTRRAARGQRRGRPDPLRRPGPARGHPGADQQQPGRAPAGRHPAAGAAAGLRLADRGGQRERPTALRPGGGADRGAAGAVLAVPPAVRRAGRHRLAVRPVGAVARGARRAGPDRRRRHVAGGQRGALPGRGRDRAARRRRCNGSTCPTMRWSTPTTTRSGSADERD